MCEEYDNVIWFLVSNFFQREVIFKWGISNDAETYADLFGCVWLILLLVVQAIKKCSLTCICLPWTYGSFWDADGAENDQELCNALGFRVWK